LSTVNDPARDVVVLHHLHRCSARLVVSAPGTVGDDHQKVPTVVPTGHPTAGEQETDHHASRGSDGHDTHGTSLISRSVSVEGPNELLRRSAIKSILEVFMIDLIEMRVAVRIVS